MPEIQPEPTRQTAGHTGPSQSTAEPVRYETGRGCLVLTAVMLLLLGLMIAGIVVLGDTPTVG